MEANNPISAKILDKIQRLISLSENNSNLNEAASAFAKAQELLTKHQLTMAEVQLASKTLEAGEPIVEGAIPLYEGQRVVHWKSWLANMISQFNSCKMFVRTYKRPKKVVFCIVGRPSDIEVVNYLFNSVVYQIEEFCKKNMDDGFGEGKTYANNFKMGATETVVNRLREAREEVRKQYSGSAALVLVDSNFEAVQKWVDNNIGKLGKGTTTYSRHDNSGREAGRAAGNRVSLNQGMGSGGSSGKLLK